MVMNLIPAVLRPRRRVPDEVVARRVESERARKARADADSERRRAALAIARQLGRVSEPMTPREQIAAQVAAERQMRRRS